MRKSEKEERLAVGVDLGGTNIRVALINELGQILKECNRKTEADRDRDYIIQNMITMIKTVKEDRQIQGIGIGSPGPINQVKGLILDPPNLKTLHQCSIVEMIQSEIKEIPIYLENDANVAALAEARAGAGFGKKSVIYITVSTGIGAGIVIDGKLFVGEQGNAGEIGNMIIRESGPTVSNLNTGSLEALASGTAIAREGKNRLGIHGGAKEVFQLAMDGDEVAINIVDEVISYLSIGIANLMHTFNPSIFVLGGGVMQSGSWLLPQLREKTADLLFPSMKNHLIIEPPMLDKKAGVIGAGFLVI
ncbi:ROK family protein [Neobacillus novalis]|uniref:ROK family protein n=1 Tax=Neobacillus novalis TaxID=220687 RepID=A0AA95MM44_9BACI|nr:ROK family protein [Neobacillus novalis]WHY85697.1 ROK family protein [Neobacillus novalis]